MFQWRKSARYPIHGSAIAVASLLVACCITPTAIAQTDNIWTGPNGGDFATAANWSQNRVPTSSDVVVFSANGSATAVYDGANRDVDSIRIDTGVFGLNLGDPDTRLRSTNNSRSVQVGTVDHAFAALLISNGGVIDASDSNAIRSIAPAPFATGSVVVSVDGSWLHSASSNVGLLVGDRGTGNLEVNSNGLVTAQFVAVGQYGRGTVLVRDNATLRSDEGIFIGSEIGGAGQVVVDGNGLLEQTGSDNVLSIGGDFNSAEGTGTLEIRNGGVVDLGNGALTSVWPGSQLTLNGGTLRTAQLSLRGGDFAWNSGRLQGAAGGNIDRIVVDGDELHPSTMALKEGIDLSIDETLTVSGFGTFQLSGGSLTVPSIANTGRFEFEQGNLAITNQGLMLADGQLLGRSLTLDDQMSLRVGQAITVNAAGLLNLAGGTATATGGMTVQAGGRVQLAPGSIVSGGTLTNQGTLAGGGRIENLLSNGVTGQVIAREGDWLHFARPADGGAAHANGGDLFLDNGTMQFDHLLSNVESGRILGRGELILGTGMSSAGLMHFDAGVSDIHGDVQLLASSRTIISAGGTATFFDDVTNNGDLFFVRDGAAAVFVGALTGAGISGPGQVFVDGTLQPGNSPGLMNFGGDLILGNRSRTVMEIDGPLPATGYDQIQVDGTLMAGGRLAVEVGDVAQISVGQRYQLLEFGSAQGAFGSFDIPELPGVLAFATTRLLTDGSLHVVSEIVGDANADGATNLADFNLLKSNFGATDADWSRGDFDLDGTTGLADFNLLKSNFGASGAAAVPEPAAIWLALAGLVSSSLLLIRRR